MTATAIHRLHEQPQTNCQPRRFARSCLTTQFPKSIRQCVIAPTSTVTLDRTRQTGLGLRRARDLTRSSRGAQDSTTGEGKRNGMECLGNSYGRGQRSSISHGCATKAVKTPPKIGGSAVKPSRISPETTACRMKGMQQMLTMKYICQYRSNLSMQAWIPVHGGSLNQLERHHSRAKQVAGCSERTSRRQESSVEIPREKRQAGRRQVLFHAAGYVRGPTAARVTKKGVVGVEKKRMRMFFEESSRTGN